MKLIKFILQRSSRGNRNPENGSKRRRIDSTHCVNNSDLNKLPFTSRNFSEENDEHYEKTIFNTLIDHNCLDKTLDWLDVNSLCSLSKTCKSLRETVKEYFKSKYPSLAIDIGDEDESNPMHLECFGDVVQHLQLSGASVEDFQLASFQVNKNLRELSFNRTTADKKEDHITKDHINAIKDILQNVKTVCATSCIFEKRSAEYLLDQCKCIEDFGFAILKDSKENFQFQKIVSLRNLEICFDSKVNVIESMKIINKKDLHLNQLVLAFAQEHNDHLKYIFDELESLHQKGLFRKLYLNFEKKSMLNEHISRLSSMQFLEGIICAYKIDHNMEDHLLDIAKLQDIRYLCINHLLVDADTIAKQLNQLVEVKIDGATIEAITSFVRYSANLIKLFNKHIRGSPKLNAKTLSKQRASMKYNIKYLIIFIPEEKFLKLKWSLCPMIGDLVEIRREESNIPQKSLTNEALN